MTDCLIIGFNDSSFDEYVEMVRSMGPRSGAFRDLDLTFVELDGRKHRSMDLLNRFYFEDKGGVEKPFHNADFLWPVVLYLGTYLARRGFSFDYVNLFHLEKEKLREKLLDDDILTIAITTTLYVSAHPILEVISFIREHNERARIIVGGPYVKNQTSVMDPESLERLFRYVGADFYVISQEGEAALANLLAALKGGGSLDAVDNIAYRQGDRYVVTACSPESNPLTENAVDYGLFPRRDIGEFISLRTAKSCPFSCSFCGFPQRAGKYTYVDVPQVERELSTLADLGVTTLTFLDDTFNVPKKRFQEILRMMSRNRYGFHWNSFYRSDHGDAETIELMALAGCEGVFLGVESGSDEMLKRMNKTSRRKNYMEAIPLLQGAGISCHTNLIVGFPGETLETVEETISLVEETRPDFFRAQLWYADPVTPIWKQKDEYGVLGEAFNWSHRTMDYQMACDLVDRMFLAVEGSVWLPQYGFEQWSTFYLQRKGMSLGQIKTFLRCWNAAVKEKLIHPERRELSPELLAPLAESCRFDRAAPPDLAPVERLSGAGYKAAERFWAGELARPLPAGLELGGDGAPTPWAAFPCPVAAGVADRLSGRFSGGFSGRFSDNAGAGLPALLLAAFAALLSRVQGREEAYLLAAPEDGGELLFPLRLAVPWNLGFAAFAQGVEARLRGAAEHGRYALTILGHPGRRASEESAAPLPEAGFAWSGQPGPSPRSPVIQAEQAFALWPEVGRGVGLLLAAAAGPEGCECSLVYRPGRLGSGAVEELGRHLGALLTAVERDPDLLLGDLPLVAEWAGPRAVESDAREAFTF